MEKQMEELTDLVCVNSILCVCSRLHSLTIQVSIVHHGNKKLPRTDMCGIQTPTQFSSNYSSHFTAETRTHTHLQFNHKLYDK